MWYLNKTFSLLPKKQNIEFNLITHQTHEDDDVKVYKKWDDWCSAGGNRIKSLDTEGLCDRMMMDEKWKVALINCKVPLLVMHATRSYEYLPVAWFITGTDSDRKSSKAVESVGRRKSHLPSHHHRHHQHHPEHPFPLWNRVAISSLSVLHVIVCGEWKNASTQMLSHLSFYLLHPSILTRPPYSLFPFSHYSLFFAAAAALTDDTIKSQVVDQIDFQTVQPFPLLIDAPFTIHFHHPFTFSYP